ncbi:hypothetical protein GF323_04880 [Candidatus Woesearchaeota archaeon]|nr:hypothetical protein [Candidatus Woesearchaeota archaeon]
MDFDKAHRAYTFHFNYLSKFKTKAKAKEIKNSDSPFQLITAPFDNFNALVELVKEKSETGIEYLLHPSSWNGPLELDCIIGREGNNLVAIFYGNEKEYKYFNEDIRAIFESVGIVGNPAGLLSIVKGGEDYSWFLCNVPYFRLHNHIENVSPSSDDKKIARKKIERFRYHKPMPHAKFKQVGC